MGTCPLTFSVEVSIRRWIDLEDLSKDYRQILHVPTPPIAFSPPLTGP